MFDENVVFDFTYGMTSVDVLAPYLDHLWLMQSWPVSVWCLRMSYGSGSGPYSRQSGKSKGKGKVSKGWVCSEECMESILGTVPTSSTVMGSFSISPAPPPLDSDLRPAFVLEVREWLRTGFTLAELDVLFN